MGNGEEEEGGVVKGEKVLFGARRISSAPPDTDKQRETFAKYRHDASGTRVLLVTSHRPELDEIFALHPPRSQGPAQRQIPR